MTVLARTAAAVTLGAGGWLAIAAAPAAAGTPSDTGCPTAYSQLAVAPLTDQGYLVPAWLDDPANGGNGDGQVCGKPLNPVVQNNICGNSCPVPVIYNFYDNNRTPDFKG